MKYVCQICGYVYDEAKEKVPFDRLPADWKCPLCGAEKKNFRPAAGEEKKAAPAAVPLNAGTGDFSAGRLAAIFSNLARGCEKQYKAKEAALFGELADYFTAAVPENHGESLEKLAADLKKDAEDYAGIRAVVDADGDRGAARVCVWGEKVTRMLESLVSRYLEEGEKMLQGTCVWVCTTCGFVYIGDKPPERCPVCKVPDWKFEKVEGRA